MVKNEYKQFHAYNMELYQINANNRCDFALTSLAETLIYNMCTWQQGMNLGILYTIADPEIALQMDDD